MLNKYGFIYRIGLGNQGVNLGSCTSFHKVDDRNHQSTWNSYYYRNPIISKLRNELTD